MAVVGPEVVNFFFFYEIIELVSSRKEGTALYFLTSKSDLEPQLQRKGIFGD